MRIRTIKPELTLDEELAELGFAARYFFVNLFCHADKNGRAEDRPMKLKALILPWDDMDADVLLNELSPKFVIRYEVGGRHYLQIRSFLKHQRPHPNEPESGLPAPPTENESKSCKKTAKQYFVVKKHGENVRKGKERKGREGKGKETSSGLAPAAMTPIQLVIRGYKVAKDLDPNDKAWDKHNFSVHARAANKLLEAFQGRAEAAMTYLIGLGQKWDDSGISDWTLAAVARHAWDNRSRIAEEKEDGIDGTGASVHPGMGDSQHQGQMGTARVLGPGGRGGITPAGAVTGQVIRQIEHRSDNDGPTVHGPDGDPL